MYNERCQKVISDLLDGDVLLVPANIEVIRNNDITYPFYQDSNLLYLTGWLQPNAVLLISKSGLKFFCQEVNPDRIVWDGAHLGVKDAQTILNMPAYELSKLPEHLRGYKRYFSTKPTSTLISGIKCADYTLSMRVIKSDSELDSIKQAVKFTIEGHKHLFTNIKPGCTEKTLYGMWLSKLYEFGLCYEAYPAIIAAGVNSCTLHYTALNGTCDFGKLLLIDAGMEYSGYAADLTRTIPIGGKFSKDQLKVYDQVLQIQLLAERFCKPGISLLELNSYVDSLYEQALVSLGIKGKIRQYAPHGIGHALGLDVHDIGLDKSMPIPEGAVLTIEPGLYFPEQEIGIRIEDNYLMTSSGLQCLSSDLPKSISEIEGICHL